MIAYMDSGLKNVRLFTTDWSNNCVKYSYSVSYAGHSLVVGGSYPSAEVQSVYSTAQADWARANGLKSKKLDLKEV